MHGKTVEVGAPPVPAGNHRTDHLIILNYNQTGIRVTVQQSVSAAVTGEPAAG
jgi:hypothetical protein